MVIRYRGDPATVEAAVERQWKQMINDVPFQAKFSEDIVRKLYKAEDSRAKIFAAFSLLAVLIGCLGLFGLAAFTAERRTKEIGIRKVLGARTQDIVRLLVWQFSRPVMIANLIAWPIAWWVMRDWLNTFDQRIALGPTPFVFAALVALVIAIGTVIGHAIRMPAQTPSTLCGTSEDGGPRSRCGVRGGSGEFGAKGEWRPEPESNRRARICSPLRNHSAIGPEEALLSRECGGGQPRGAVAHSTDDGWRTCQRMNGGWPAAAAADKSS